MKTPGLLTGFLLLVTTSLNLQAEGAVRLIDCTVLQACDADGECQPGAAQHTFRLEPSDVGLDGAGTWTVRYDGTEATMQSLSDAGPFYWTLENGLQRHTLIASSETRFVWHRLDIENGPQASLVFLDCRITL